MDADEEDTLALADRLFNAGVSVASKETYLAIVDLICCRERRRFIASEVPILLNNAIIAAHCTVFLSSSLCLTINYIRQGKVR